MEHKQDKSRKQNKTENETEIEIVSKRSTKIENKKKLNVAGDIKILDNTIVKQSDEIRGKLDNLAKVRILDKRNLKSRCRNCKKNLNEFIKKKKKYPQSLNQKL